ncbi:MAG: YeiH family protein [Bacteroides sp.]
MATSNATAPESASQGESFLKRNNKLIYKLVLAVLTLCLLAWYLPACRPFTSWVTPPVALFSGLAFALLCGQPFPKFNKKMSKYLLQYSVVGLGFGMNLEASLASGKEGMEFTVISVVGTLLIGWLLGRKLLKVNRDTSYLISSGTAICGGSAIAAVGSVLKAKDSDMSVALGTIFILNAIALFIFPPIGHALGMDQQQFGMWAAIAIHDTSSVVGAGAAYGEEALQVATTIKLTRALWIIPLALLTSVMFNRKGGKISIPWFILFFVLAMVVNTYLLSTTETGAMIGRTVNSLARQSLTVTLFFIGASLSRDVIKQVGIKPMVQGILLWIVISLATLGYILL